MSRRRMSRALLALVVPALTLTTLTSPAQAAAKAPKVPSITQVAKIYPHLAGGTASTSTSKVRGTGKNCKAGKAIPGAKATGAAYLGANPADLTMTAAKPMISLSALKFRSTASARAFLRSTNKVTKKCANVQVPGASKAKVTKLKLARLGDERWGYTVKVKISGENWVSRAVLVRKGRSIVQVSATASKGAPAVKPLVKLTKVALRQAR